MKIIIDEGKKEVKLYITRSDLDSVSLTALFPWYKLKPKMEDIDEELRPLIRNMWDNGYRTFNCCSGHRKIKGFIVFLPPRKRILRGATWELNEPIPEGISQLGEVLPMTSITLDSDKDDGGIKKWLAVQDLQRKQRSEGERLSTSPP